MKSDEGAPCGGDREWVRRGLTLEAAAALFSGRVDRHLGAEARSRSRDLDQVKPAELTEE
jgi:hypothetical protein